jgi:AraC family transcriptional regulator
MVTLTELVRHHSTLATAPGHPEGLSPRRLRRILDYLEAHLSEDLSLLALAAEAGLSPGHFARGFKQAIGRPVHQYLLRRRVESASCVLAGTDQPISDVALAVGFCSQAHLTTAFRRVYGTTPAAYRRQSGG